MRRALRERRLEPARLVELAQAEPNLAALARQAIEGQPRAVVVLARSTVAGRLVAELRQAGYRGTVLGGATLGGAAYARAASGAAEGVLAPCWAATDTVGWRTFASAYRRRFGGEPDIASAQGYDAVRLLAAAVRSGGLNRARIRDALRAASGWQGAAGTVRWNALGRNEPSVRLGAWRGGSLHDAPQLVSSP